MFREPKKPTLNFRQPRMVIFSIIFGVIILLFLNSEVLFLILGIFLVFSGILISTLDVLNYQKKLRFFNNRLEKINNSEILSVDKFSGEKFEFFLKELFQSLGYLKVQLTKRTRDFGVDLIMFKQDGTKIVIQAKRYTKNVGNKAINEAVGTRLPEQADEVWVVTNSYFTKPAKEHARKNKVKLIDRDELMNLILKKKSILKS
jgi:restriction system protein